MPEYLPPTALAAGESRRQAPHKKYGGMMDFRRKDRVFDTRRIIPIPA